MIRRSSAAELLTVSSGRRGGCIPATFVAVAVMVLASCGDDQGAADDSATSSIAIAGRAHGDTTSTVPLGNQNGDPGDAVTVASDAIAPTQVEVVVTLPSSTNVGRTTDAGARAPRDDLETALLTPGDVDQEWQTEGPEVQEVSAPAEGGTPWCTDGIPLPEPRRIATVDFETVPVSGRYFSEALLQFGSEVDVGACP